MPCLRLLTLCAVVLGALGAADARGDHEETEARLKAAGVDGALRGRIHRSIDRGVAYLAAQQQPDGSFRPPRSPGGTASGGVRGVTLLCALALRHAGRPAAEEPVQRALAQLLPWLEESSRTGTGLSVYDAGLALLLLQAVGRPQPEAPRIAALLARGLDARTGWWGYGAPRAGTAGPYQANTPNLSTAQFAGLGLWAARRMGHDTDVRVWQVHAEALLASQTTHGSWPYGPTGTSGSWEGLSPPRDGYFTGTCMGVANLLLARQALRSATPTSTDLLARVDAAISRALESLGADGITYLRDPLAGELYFNGDKLSQHAPDRTDARPSGFGAYYSLYALEKACLFADLETLSAPGRAGKVPWYARAAAWLVARQRDDGGWPPATESGATGQPSDVIESALALLVLLRSPQTAHPTTPRDVDLRPGGPTTPGAGAPGR